MNYLNNKMKFVSTVLASFILPLSLSVQALTPEPAPAQTKAIAITGVTAHIGNGEVIDNATITFNQGKITSIGKATASTNLANHQTIDLKGKHLYPGFILPNTQMGLVEVNAIRATRDQRESTQLNPSIRSITSYNTDSELIPTFRFNGILTAQIKPSGGMISGLSSLVSMDGWNWQDAAYAVDTGMHLNWPGVYTNRFDFATFTRKTEKNKGYKKQVQQLSELFDAASIYDSKSAVNLKLKAVKNLLDGKVQLFIHTNGAREIVNSVKFAKSYGIKNIVLVGASDALLVVDFLKQEDIPVILSGVHSLPKGEDDDVDQAFKLPAQLTKAGLKIAIGSSSTIQPQGARNLAFGAGTTAAY